MVSEDGERVFGPPQVMSPVGEGLHHGKQLSLVDIVITLCGSEGGGVVGNGVEFRFSFLVGGGISFSSFLGEHCSDPVCGGVSLQVEASFEVRLDEDGLSTHKGFKCLKRFELGLPPLPYYVFLG